MKKILVIFILSFMLLTLFSQTKDISFQNSDIKDVLMQLGQLYNSTIIFSNDLTGEVNIILYDISLDAALKVILSSFGYSYEKIEDVYVVFSESSFSYYIPHIYKPKNRSAKSIVEVLRVIQAYAVGDNVVIYCPNELWPQYLKKLQEVDSESKNLVVSYVVYYIKNSDIKKYNLEPQKLLDLIPALEKAKFVTNTSGFFVGNEIKLNTIGGISLSAEMKNNKLKFNLKSQNDSVNYESQVSMGFQEYVLNGSFGKFIVLINISELKSKIEEKMSNIDYVPDKTFSFKYYSSNDFKISLSDKNLEAVILKDNSYFVGVNMKLVDDFYFGAMIQLDQATNLILSAKDTYYFNPIFVELFGSFPIDISNLGELDGPYLAENLDFGLGIGTTYKVNNDVLLMGKVSMRKDLLISGELGIKYLNYNIGMSLNSLLIFGVLLGISW